MENIRFGKPDATDAEVMDAAKQANADRFITSFPDGYNTMVGMCSHLGFHCCLAIVLDANSKL